MALELREATSGNGPEVETTVLTSTKAGCLESSRQNLARRAADVVVAVVQRVSRACVVKALGKVL